MSTELITCKTNKPRNLNREIPARKRLVADRLKAALNSSNYFVFFQFGDLNCQEWNNVRHELGELDINVKVFPNKISSKVLEDTKYRNVGSFFKHPVVTCRSSTSNIDNLLNVTKKYSKLSLIGGMVEEKLMTAQQVKDYSKLPSIDVMNALTLQNIMQPCQQLTGNLNQALILLAHNLKEHEKSL